MGLKQIVSLALLASVMIGCKEEKKDEKPKVIPKKEVAQEDSVVQTPDKTLHQVVGPVAYIVTEKSGYAGDEQGDSVSFDKDGSLIALVSWSGSGRNRSVYSDIRLLYNEEGEFERGEQMALEAPLVVVIERNNQGQLQKLGVLPDKSERYAEAAYTETWEWTGSLPTHYEFAGWEWGNSMTYKYDKEGEKTYPQRSIGKSEDEEGNIKTDVTYEYTEFDDEGNWVSRKVKEVSKMYDYDVQTGRIVTVGSPKTEKYVERRRIGYFGKR